MTEDLTVRLQQLQHEYDELEASMPAHSMKASYLQRLEDLEDEIDGLKKEIAARPLVATHQGPEISEG